MEIMGSIINGSDESLSVQRLKLLSLDGDLSRNPSPRTAKGARAEDGAVSN